MPATEFIRRYRLSPDQIRGPECVSQLIRDMELGLDGRGNIPMNPSYLRLDTAFRPGVSCCVVDAGGTNLRTAAASFGEDGSCHITGMTKVPMLGMEQELSAEEFYSTLAAGVRATDCTRLVGLCFSYNVEHQRDLDGILQSWCKEIRVPQAVGRPVGRSLQAALGNGSQVRVVNDSTAALLGAHHRYPEVTVGVILGTGINICYSEQICRIPKVPRDLKGNSMIISTEIGEFRGIPKTVFDEDVIAASDEPDMAHAEKQCSGAYLGELIARAWHRAAEEGLLDSAFAQTVTLPQISDYLSGKSAGLPDSPAARQIADIMIRRAAKIAAILTAGVVLLSHSAGQCCTLVIEGSQYGKLTGFGPAYEKELEALLTPGKITFAIRQAENSCLIGAALSAFAEPM